MAGFRVACEVDVPEPDGFDLTARGGSWDGYPEDCRSAYRGGDAPTGSSGSVGFRVALCPTHSNYATLRGGSWYGKAFPLVTNPGKRYYGYANVGFRVAGDASES